MERKTDLMSSLNAQTSLRVGWLAAAENSQPGEILEKAIKEWIAKQKALEAVAMAAALDENNTTTTTNE